MIGKMFSTPRPKRFNITTRYYNEDKEDFEARQRQSRAEAGVPAEDGSYVPHVKGQFRSAMPNASRTADAERQKSNRRLLIIVCILALIAFVVFKSGYLSNLISL
ncbi:MAG: hypothetical protein ACK5LR_12415 [Mangrovibacterium sp.]